MQPIAAQGIVRGHRGSYGREDPTHHGNPKQTKGCTVKQPELTSLIGLRDSDGDQLHLVRLDRANGSHAYLMAIGRERMFLTVSDLKGLSTVIRRELSVGDGDDGLMGESSFFARAIWLLILCALVWLFIAFTGPLWVYPWSV